LESLSMRIPVCLLSTVFRGSASGDHKCGRSLYEIPKISPADMLPPCTG
jgi:hypothetical protein